MAEANTYSYDVCLSFAGEDRPYVQQVAKLLVDANISVFYDAYEQAELWGKDLYTHLDKIYREDCRYCVIFISEHYAAKLWTNHERQSAQARAFEENAEYLLPARFDNTEIPGIRPTIGYIDLSSHSPEQLAALIVAKVRQQASQKDPTKDAVPKPTIGVDSQLIEERRSYWNSSDNDLWLVTLLYPSEPLRREFDPICSGTLEALHNLRLPGYVAGRITTQPNRYHTRSRPGRRLVHEEFTKLSEGYGFRIEVWPNGLFEISFCLTELLKYYPAGEIGHVQYGSAPVEAAKALLPYETFAGLVADQLRLLFDFWQTSEAHFTVSTLEIDLFGASGLSLLIVGRREPLVGYPLEEASVIHVYALQDSLNLPQLTYLALRDFVNDFGLSLAGFRDAQGKLIMPTLFAHG
jgi:hypothetical protein